MGAAIEFNIASEPTPAVAPSTGAERPANVPEKFWDAEKGTVNTEALLASYTSLESKLGSGAKADEQTTTETPEGATDETTTGDEKVDEIVNEAGLDVAAIEASWLESKTIPEAELEKLAKVGVTKEMAEEFIAFRQSQGERTQSELMGSVGGEEVVNTMVDWASKVYTPEKAEAFNKAVNSKDPIQIEMALKALKTDYDKANPPAKPRPKLLTPDSGQAKAGDAYQSLDQLLRDQADPRYRSDPAFRNAVIAKLGRSNI